MSAEASRQRGRNNDDRSGAASGVGSGGAGGPSGPGKPGGGQSFMRQPPRRGGVMRKILADISGNPPPPAGS